MEDMMNVKGEKTISHFLVGYSRLLWYTTIPTFSHLHALVSEAILEGFLN